jgi:hypothetical protein
MRSGCLFWRKTFRAFVFGNPPHFQPSTSATNPLMNQLDKLQISIRKDKKVTPSTSNKS